MILEGLKEIHAKGILHRVNENIFDMNLISYLAGFKAIKYIDKCSR